VFTSTGRLRANATYCQQRNTPFQGLAADGAKLALWTLWRREKRIFNFVHDEIKVREDSDLAPEVEELCEIMVESMMQVVSDVQIRVDAACCKIWNKKAKLTIENGKVIPWVEPAPAALPTAA
jgi:DNA polymerase I-like protein with 3'-5' exonuclease and polymerase domains